MSAEASLVGRQEELALVDRLVGGLAKGQGGCLLLEGEAGIGKTALLDALADRCGGAVRLLRGTASPLDRVRPFGPLFDALVPLLVATGSAGGLREAVQVLGALRVAPVGDRQSPLQTAPEQRAALVDSLVEVVEQAVLDGPTVLVVDDLHVAEAATVATLARLGSVAASGPLLLVGTRRPHPTSPEVHGLIAAWGEAGLERRVLAPLDDADLAALVALLTGGRPDAGFLELTRRTGGNPFLASQMIATLEATGGLTRTGAGIGVLDGVESRLLTAEAQANVLARFETLDEDTTSVIRTASSLGLAFTPSELATVLDRPMALVLDPLARATEAGLLVADGDALRFRHELVHEAIESTIAPALRAPLQLDIARRLNAAGAAPDRLVAHYLLGAGPGDLDAVATLRTVARSIAGQAPQSAALLLQHAHTLLPSTDPSGDEVTAELVDALMWGDQLEQAEALANDALSRPLSPELAARLHETAARSAFTLGRPADAVQHAVASAPSPDREAWALGLAAMFRLFALDLEGARADAERALVLEAATPDPWAAAMGNLVVGWVDNFQGYFSRAVERCDRAVAVADASPGREVHRLIPHLFRAMALVNAGRIDEAAAGVREGRRLAADLGTAWSAPFYHYADALAHWTNGDLDDLLVECEAGLRCAADHDAWLAAPWAYAVAAAAHLFQGRVEEAGRLLDRGEEVMAAGGSQFGLEWLLWIRALQVEMATGAETAIPLLHGAWEAAQGIQATAALSLFGPDLVRLLLGAGRADEAGSVLEALRAGEVDGERFAVDVMVQRCAGLLAGDEELIIAARVAHDGQGRKLEAVLDEEARVLVRLAASGPGAKEDLLMAVEAAEAAGFGMVADRLRRSAAASGLSTGRRAERATHGWDALTRSEWRIARLVGEGRSNPEIAAELVVSRRTVESHLSRIFTKLEVANRTELALSLRDRELA